MQANKTERVPSCAGLGLELVVGAAVGSGSGSGVGYGPEDGISVGLVRVTVVVCSVDGAGTVDGSW